MATQRDDIVKLISRLGHEIADAQMNYCLFKDLINERLQNGEVFSHSRAFWELTIYALKEAYLIGLCRIYDDHKKGVNIVRLLDRIKSFANASKANAALLDMVQLDNDILYVKRGNPLVKKLVLWRNKLFAHMAADVTLEKSPILRNNQISDAEYQELLSCCFTMINRYSVVFCDVSYAGRINGQDDYKILLELAKLGLAKRKGDADKGSLWGQDCKIAS